MIRLIITTKDNEIWCGPWIEEKDFNFENEKENLMREKFIDEEEISNTSVQRK